MNCTRAEQLIPLDAGGDLSPAEADSLRQHIETCAHCQQIAEEFTASQIWISEFAAPAFDPGFDEAAFASMRASVHREIEQMESAGEKTDRKNWFGWLLPQWSMRFAVAAAVVLLIAIGGLLVFIPRQKAPMPDVVRPDLVRKDQPSKPSTTTPDGNRTDNVNDLPGMPGMSQIANETPRSLRRNHRPNQPVQASRQFVPDIPETTAITAQATPGIEPITDPARTTDVAKAEPEMLRIEFQTADPNIRIIWFAPKAGKTEPNTK